MKIIRNISIILTSVFVLNCCSADDDGSSCPQIATISMKINGELKQFAIYGRGIDFDDDGSGHTLSLWMDSVISTAPQDTYAIIIKLPYKKTGTNIIEEFSYSRVENATYVEVDFTQAELQSRVTVNKNTCISATFSGSATINGNEIVITEGVLNHIYDNPFD